MRNGKIWIIGFSLSVFLLMGGIALGGPPDPDIIPGLLQFNLYSEAGNTCHMGVQVYADDNRGWNVTRVTVEKDGGLYNNYYFYNTGKKYAGYEYLFSVTGPGDFEITEIMIGKKKGKTFEWADSIQDPFVYVLACPSAD